MAVWKLNDELWFPDPHTGEENGLIAIGGDLSVKRLLLAYYNGFFPWYSYKLVKTPYWYCPLNRYVIFPKEIHISHSMRQLLRQQKYEVTVNEDFENVIRNCSTAQKRNKNLGAWLGPDIIEAYTRLHHLGYAASVEVWEKIDTGGTTGTTSEDTVEKRLVGGLYGVTLRKAFFGESMFSLVPNASKLALIHLAKMMESMGWHFIDCQFETPLFSSMGGKHISYDRYMEILNGNES